MGKRSSKTGPAHDQAKTCGAGGAGRARLKNLWRTRGHAPYARVHGRATPATLRARANAGADGTKPTHDGPAGDSVDKRTSMSKPSSTGHGIGHGIIPDLYS